MLARSLGWSPLVVLLILVLGFLALGGAAGPPSEAAQATPQAQPTIPRGTGRAGQSPTLLGDINNDGIVDIRDYGIWRQNFGQTNCGNPADLDGNCIVDIRDYGIWRANFGHVAGAASGPTPMRTATVTPTGPTAPRPTR